MPTKYDLQLFQRLPLDIKIAKTKLRIREWVDYYGEDGIYVSFSGGKDSTVLLDIVRKMYPDIEAVFVNTGLEYSELFTAKEIATSSITICFVIADKSYAQPNAIGQAVFFVGSARISKRERDASDA